MNCQLRTQEMVFETSHIRFETSAANFAGATPYVRSDSVREKWYGFEHCYNTYGTITLRQSGRVLGK